jgi:phosphoglycerate dehydrogenase-like enzyme
MTPKVLIADKLSPAAAQIFKDRGIETDVKPGLDRDELIKIIGQYDGVAVRSATKITEKVIASADKLKVIGRAGIGVDNIDVNAATSKGIIVMNTPFGNSITTAEHAMRSCSRSRARSRRRIRRPRPANGKRTASWASSSRPRRSASSAAAISARSSPTVRSACA